MTSFNAVHAGADEVGDEPDGHLAHEGLPEVTVEDVDDEDVEHVLERDDHTVENSL